jgi:hypothetical protein
MERPVVGLRLIRSQMLVPRTQIQRAEREISNVEVTCTSFLLLAALNHSRCVTSNLLTPNIKTLYSLWEHVGACIIDVDVRWKICSRCRIVSDTEAVGLQLTDGLELTLRGTAEAWGHSEVVRQLLKGACIENELVVTLLLYLAPVF